MIYKIYSVKDAVAGQFSEPRIFMNEGLAVRWFKNLCEKSEIASDLSLYYLGEYDLEGGAISSAPEFVMNGVLEVTK